AATERKCLADFQVLRVFGVHQFVRLAILGQHAGDALANHGLDRLLTRANRPHALAAHPLAALIERHAVNLARHGRILDTADLREAAPRAAPPAHLHRLIDNDVRLAADDGLSLFITKDARKKLDVTGVRNWDAAE